MKLQWKEDTASSAAMEGNGLTGKLKGNEPRARVIFTQ